jgi:hypothetical protein
MRKVIQTIILFSIVSLTGCNNLILPSQPDTFFTSNLSKGETVMVKPFNDYFGQIEAARNLELVLIGFNFNVKSYEIAVKEVEKRTGSGKTGTLIRGGEREVGAIGGESNEVTIERYRSFDGINADYIFDVMISHQEGIAKVVKVKEGTVVAVCNFDDFSLKHDIRECLLAKHMLIEKKQ